MGDRGWRTGEVHGSWLVGEHGVYRREPGGRREKNGIGKCNIGYQRSISKRRLIPLTPSLNKPGTSLEKGEFVEKRKGKIEECRVKAGVRLRHNTGNSAAKLEKLGEANSNDTRGEVPSPHLPFRTWRQTGASVPPVMARFLVRATRPYRGTCIPVQGREPS